MSDADARTGPEWLVDNWIDFTHVFEPVEKKISELLHISNGVFIHYSPKVVMSQQVFGHTIGLIEKALIYMQVTINKSKIAEVNRAPKRALS